jgi:phosphatidate cytidylyltransferase
MVFWTVALVWVIQAQSGRAPSGLGNALVRALAGWLTLVPCWLALVSLHGLSPSLVLLVMVLIWIADSAAFFAGRRFGRRRLASRVSPGKSWEGVIAGLGAVALAAWLLQASGLVRADRPAALVLLCLVVAAVSVLGDLNESLFKRRAGVKDSGTLIPGHGGVLDRIDSITAAAPAFSLGWLCLGISLS